MAALVVQGQETEKIRLDTSETLFSIMAALNACGYDQDVSQSLQLRQGIRTEVAQAAASPEAAEALKQMCRFYVDHRPQDPGRDVAQYISLALSLGEPPAFTPSTKEADLAPDASYVLGLVPLLSNFYRAAGLHNIWTAHRSEYEALVEHYHEPVANMMMATDVYLKLPLSGYLGRGFSVYLEPLASPGQVNARNYGADYFLVVSPSSNGSIRLEQIRHTYLHYILDPMSQKRAIAMKRLSPLLESVRSAPIDETYKNDISLLVTESLIRAIEARTLGGPKGAEGPRQAAVEADEREGFILTRYFYDALREFEKQPTGFRDAFGDMLHYIDVDRERKAASQVAFAASAAPEVVRAAKPAEDSLLDAAEKQLANGNPEGARKLAQEALDSKKDDDARALFVLARAATLAGDMKNASGYFERTLHAAKEPRLIAWSHIYLGRISDIQEARDAAIQHYRAALAAGDTTPETKAAAERGLKQPFQRPRQERDKE